MKATVIVSAALIAAATFLIEPMGAQAARAVVTDTVNVRAGPSVDYRVVGRMHRGDRVNVTRCTQSRRWCHVERRHGRDGWVNSRYLSRPCSGGHHNRPNEVCFYGAHGYICLTQ